MPATPVLGEWLSAGPFTLSLSSGFFGFFAHTGMLMALEEQGLSPARVTGSSAGALAGACWCAGLPAQALARALGALHIDQFWDPGLGLGLLKGERFRRLLGEWLPVTAFEQCRTPVTVSAFDMIRRETVLFDAGPLAPAVHASCAVPLMFQPVRHQGRLLLDGGLSDRPALAAVEADERVFYHHIASRSPWRRRNSPALEVPNRNGLMALVIDHLPRSGPRKLKVGMQALELAHEATRRALQRPVASGVLRLSAG